MWTKLIGSIYLPIVDSIGWRRRRKRRRREGSLWRLERRGLQCVIQ